MPGFNVWSQLERVSSGVLPVEGFEQWVYDSPELATELGPEFGFALLEFNYRQPRALRELQSLIRRIYHELRPGGHPRDVARRVAEDYLAGRLYLHDAARTLARLWAAGEEWISAEFMYMDSELDRVPHPDQHHLWDPEALQETLQLWKDGVAEFDRTARAGCTQILAYLDASAA